MGRCHRAAECEGFPKRRLRGAKGCVFHCAIHVRLLVCVRGLRIPLCHSWLVCVRGLSIPLCHSCTVVGLINRFSILFSVLKARRVEVDALVNDNIVVSAVSQISVALTDTDDNVVCAESKNRVVLADNNNVTEPL